MLRGLWKLTWLEIKIFVREPLGVIGTVVIPVLLFLFLGRILGPRIRRAPESVPPFVAGDLPIFVALMIAMSAVLSLVAIIAIYREGGILKRLRATPLRAHTILSAHVLVKLLFTAATVTLMILAGRSYYPVGSAAPLLSFLLAVVFTTLCVLSLGFVIASVVPTSRFAQPLGTLILYPMLGLSGLFVPLDAMPDTLQAVARALPLTYAVNLLRGIWRGDSWLMHTTDIAVLAALFAICIALSARVFRWE